MRFILIYIYMYIKYVGSTSVLLHIYVIINAALCVACAVPVAAAAAAAAVCITVVAFAAVAAAQAMLGDTVNSSNNNSSRLLLPAENAANMEGVMRKRMYAARGPSSPAPAAAAAAEGGPYEQNKSTLSFRLNAEIEKNNAAASSPAAERSDFLEDNDIFDALMPVCSQTLNPIPYTLTPADERFRQDSQ